MQRILVGIWLFMSLLAGTPAIALDPTRSIAEMFHRAYTRDDGLSGAVEAIAQTPDGFLWVGTDDGLYRFDGVRFEHIADKRFLSGGVFALKVTSSGDMWISYAEGGLSRLHAGAVTNYSATAAGGELMAQEFLEAPKGGGLWATGGYGPYRLDGRNWRVVPGPWAPASQTLWSTEPGRDGTLWAKSADGVFYCRPGCVRFVTAHGYAGAVMGFTRDRDGRVWTSDSRAPGDMYAMPDLSGVGDSAIPGPAYGGQIFPRAHGKIFLDRDGTLWNQNVPHGLLRLRSIRAGRSDPAQADVYGTSDGLSSDIVTSFFEDREGNIWVATFAGLDRFRPANVVLERQMPTKTSVHGYNAGVTADALFFYANTGDDTSSRAAMNRGPLYRVDADSSVHMVLPEMDWPYVLAPASDGGLWVGLSQGLYKLKDAKLTEEFLPASLHGTTVREIAEPAAGVLWLVSATHGLWRRVNGVWSHVRERPDDEAKLWQKLTVDSRGVPWLTDGRTIARCVNGSLLEIPANNGPGLGAIYTMAADRRGMLFGGNFGLARFDAHGFHALRSERVPALAIVSGIVETGGQTWIASQAGILRFDTNVLERALTEPDALPPHYELFDHRDGVPGGIQQSPYSASNRSAFLGPDGRIWFLTDGGIAWVDPHHISRNAVLPPVAIHSLTVDGRSYAALRDIKLSAGVSNLEIDYAALSFVEPGRVQFRYKLDGVDNAWVDPGQRREAFYTRLGPGNYTFRVIASNNDGVWNTKGASVSFVIPPTFLQSWLFVVICVLSGTIMLGALYRLRLGQMAGRVRSRLEERIRERERIARELHDTLLQSVQGLVLRFYAAVENMPPDASRQELERTIERADQVLADARERVRHLRAADNRSDLPGALREAGKELAEGRTASFRMIVEGTARELHAIVCEEMTWIGREALTNAFTHSNARQVVAEISYRWRELRLQLWDDGRGLPEDVALTGTRADHFGLVGIRERVKRIRGRLTLHSRPGSGTAITVVVPAAVAYKDIRQRWSFDRIRRLFAEEIET